MLGLLAYLPLEHAASRMFVDEHAFQPNQVTLVWGPGEVQRVDMLARELSANSREEMGHGIAGQLDRLGVAEWGVLSSLERAGAGVRQVSRDSVNLHPLESSQETQGTQDTHSTETSYVDSSTQTPDLEVPQNPTQIGFPNLDSYYAVVRPKRTFTREAILIGIPYTTSSGPNTHAIATALTMIPFLSDQIYWAKNIVFCFTKDQQSMADFLKEYHAVNSTLDIAGQFLFVQGIALEIQDPSFSYISIGYQGLNGQLPNLDMLSAVSSVIRGQNVQVAYHGNQSPGPWSFDAHLPFHYLHNLWHILKGVQKGASGEADSLAGVMNAWRIDAVSIQTVSSPGHNRHTALEFGKVVEASLRACNNLIERLHATVFFYLILNPTRYVQLGRYLPIAILPGVVLTFFALQLHFSSPTSGADWVAGAAAIGATLLAHTLFAKYLLATKHLGFLALFCTLQGPMTVMTFFETMEGIHSLRILSLFLAGLLTPILSLVNFPLAFISAIYLLLMRIPVSRSIGLAFVHTFALIFVSPICLLWWYKETWLALVNSYDQGNIVLLWCLIPMQSLIIISGACAIAPVLRLQRLSNSEMNKKQQ